MYLLRLHHFRVVNSDHNDLCGSPGLVVMRRGSRSKGCGFESQDRMLDRHFSHIFVIKIVMMFEKTENKQKKAGVGPFFKKRTQQLYKSRENRFPQNKSFKWQILIRPYP